MANCLYLIATVLLLILPGLLVYSHLVRKHLDAKLGTERLAEVLIRDTSFSLLFGLVAISVVALGAFSVFDIALDRPTVLALEGALVAALGLVLLHPEPRADLVELARSRARMIGRAPLRTAFVLACGLLVLVTEFSLLRFEDTAYQPGVWRPCRHEVGLLMSQIDKHGGVSSINPRTGLAETFLIDTHWNREELLHAAAGAQRLLVLANIAVFIGLWAKVGLVFGPLLWTFALSGSFFLLAALVTRRGWLRVAVAAFAWHASNTMLFYMNNENVMAAAANGGLLVLVLAFLGLGAGAERRAASAAAPVPLGICLAIGILYGAGYGFRLIEIFFVPAMMFAASCFRASYPARKRRRLELTPGPLIFLGYLLAAAPTLLEITETIGVPLPLWHPRIFVNLANNDLWGLRVPFWPLNFPIHDQLVRAPWNRFPSQIMTSLYLLWAWGVAAMALILVGFGEMRRDANGAWRFLLWFLGVYLLVFAHFEQLLPHQYTYLTQLFPAFVPALGLALDRLLERGAAHHVRSRWATAALALTVAVVGAKSVSATVDTRVTPMREEMPWDPRGFIFRFPFDLRAALPPPPHVEPNRGFLEWVKFIDRDVQPAHGPLVSGRTFVFEPKVIEHWGVFEKDFDLLPLPEDEVQDFQRRTYWEAIGVLVEVPTPRGAPVHIQVRAEPEEMKDPHHIAKQVAPKDPSYLVDITTGRDSSAETPVLQTYAFFEIGATYVRPENMVVRIDGERLPTSRYIGNDQGGWLTNLPETAFPTFELGLRPTGHTRPLEYLKAFVYDFDFETGPSVQRSLRSFIQQPADHGELHFRWPVAAGSYWMLVHTIYSGDTRPLHQLLFSGPMSELAATDGRIPTVDLDAVPSEPVNNTNHPIMFLYDGNRTPPRIPVRTGPPQS